MPKPKLSARERIAMSKVCFTIPGEPYCDDCPSVLSIQDSIATTLPDLTLAPDIRRSGDLSHHWEGAPCILISVRASGDPVRVADTIMDCVLRAKVRKEAVEIRINQG